MIGRRSFGALRIGSAAVLVAASLIGWPRIALACSGALDPAEYTQALIYGRVRALTVGPLAVGGFREATVTVAVEHTYRGEKATELTYVDRASVSVSADARGASRVDYAGGSGACGTIDADPVGKHVLIALARGDDGRWLANRLYGAIYGTRPDDFAYRWLIDRHHIPVLTRSHPGLAAAPWQAFVER